VAFEVTRGEKEKHIRRDEGREFSDLQRGQCTCIYTFSGDKLLYCRTIEMKHDEREQR
jgi:hypothetical protein